ncbi:MAG: hypothetical protein M1812_001616 [Candelaria pacifica]|nr:MAG: hypothetical protein M1812_001616 [Candelaria pacifica]
MVFPFLQKARQYLLNTTFNDGPKEHHSMRPSIHDDPAPTTSLAQFSHLCQTTYSSKPVAIPPSFLESVPSDSHPITCTKIEWSNTDLPEYKGSYTIVLDNVLSPSECTQLIRLAEESAGASDEGAKNKGWKPAMVNAGAGWEVFDAGYRKSDRIIWDQEDVAGRIWKRCLNARGLWDDLGILQGKEGVLGWRACERGDKWRATRLNERMRFLRYGKGQFFRGKWSVRDTFQGGGKLGEVYADLRFWSIEHCDGSYNNEKTGEKSFYTVHLYLNDSVQTCPHLATTKPLTEHETAESDEQEEEPLIGGATTFHSRDFDRAKTKKTLDVDPKAGRVLIFQHNGLLHSGNDVLAGVKYTMRTDLMFEFIQN